MTTGGAGGTGGAAGGAGAGAAGMAGMPGTGGVFANFAEAGAWINGTCGVSGCHFLRYPPALSSTDPMILQTDLSTYTVIRCGSAALIVPGNPDGSALYMAITGQCTDLLMPFGCIEPFSEEPPCITQADIDKIRAWIASPNPFL